MSTPMLSVDTTDTDMPVTTLARVLLPLVPIFKKNQEKCVKFFIFKLANAVTKLEQNSGKSFPMNMVLTQLVHTTVTVICSWSVLTVTTMNLLAANMSLEQS